jgi:hypothetical protein
MLSRFLLLAFVFVLVPLEGKTQEIRFAPYSGELAYGLTVLPPWQDGGRLVINFPEHLEAGTEGEIGILRHYFKEPGRRWQVARDGKTAALNLESPKTPGVWVSARGRIAGRDRIEFVFVIRNETTHPLVWVTPLFCYQYAGLTGFPQKAPPSPDPFPNFDHIYTVMGGRVVQMSAVRTRDPHSRVRGATVVGCNQPENPFAENHGGRLDSPVDAAISAVTSLSDRRKLILAWTPGKSFLSNAEIPCLHADPYFGTIRPGRSAEARGLLILTEGAVEPPMLRMLKRGEGKAAKPVAEEPR